MTIARRLAITGLLLIGIVLALVAWGFVDMLANAPDFRNYHMFG